MSVVLETNCSGGVQSPEQTVQKTSFCGSGVILPLSTVGVVNEAGRGYSRIYTCDSDVVMQE